MNALVEITSSEGPVRGAHDWLARVLIAFATAEQAIGKLCLALDLPIEKGSLSNLEDLRRRLRACGDKHCIALDNRIGRWASNRPFRHLLAHATLHEMRDATGREIIVTRHLPRDRNDVTPDRMWTPEERHELWRQATNDGRSIYDQARNLEANPAIMARLRGL
jgi:hypothetical protein